MFRSFNAVNMGSLGQRAAKLPAFKVEGLEKSLLLSLGPIKPVGPGWALTGSESFSKFEGWQLSRF